MDAETTIEIRKVANGFVISRGYDVSRAGYITDRDDILVFNKYIDLAIWLKQHFGVKE
jgi:hypothetical protein